MADYDSDSSGAEDVVTNVLLGYASRDSTGDDFSQLGGHPTWLDEDAAPSGTYAKCRVCNDMMNLLLQLNGDLPERFPDHERRLYVWACRRKACRRRDGSVRGLRVIRSSGSRGEKPAAVPTKASEKQEGPSQMSVTTNLGETLFGVKSPTASPANPFSSQGTQNISTNPFATASSLAAKPAQKPTEVDSLPQTFAEKMRISSPEPVASPKMPSEPWPEQSKFPTPFPAYHIDADQEYIEPEATDTPSGVRIERDGEGGSGNSAAEDKAAFESTMDKTFQRFADRLAQNPEQVLRYEYGGQPLLYAKADAVGKLFGTAQERANAKVKVTGRPADVPKCSNCGAKRVFEMQLTPHAIAELEAEEISVDGMDWGTIILCVCSKDCQEAGKTAGEVGCVEEWIGVQWEEVSGRR